MLAFVVVDDVVFTVHVFGIYFRTNTGSHRRISFFVFLFFYPPFGKSSAFLNNIKHFFSGLVPLIV